jgi:hypothetical protein
MATGDSMTREIFYGLTEALSNRVPPSRSRIDLHWRSDDGNTTLDLFRTNFAIQLAHSIDTIYHDKVIAKLYADNHHVLKSSQTAIHEICDRRPKNRQYTWFSCRHFQASMNHTNIGLLVGGAAAWEPRAFIGLYGYYSNEVHATRSKHLMLCTIINYLVN